MPHDATIEDVKRALPAQLAADAQGERPLSRWLQTQPALNSVIDAVEPEAEAVPEPSPSRAHRRADRPPLHRRRRRLPDRRAGLYQKARIASQDLPAHREHADRTLGEIFVDMHKEGAASAA